MNMLFSLGWRDLIWLTKAFTLSGAASGALAAAVVVESRTLLDLPWIVICGSIGLAMFGGLVGTLFTVHSAGASGAKVNVPMQVAADLGCAAVLGFVAYAVVVAYGWEPEVLLGSLPLLGVAGQKVLVPLIKSLVTVAGAVGNRLSGKVGE